MAELDLDAIEARTKGTTPGEWKSVSRDVAVGIGGYEREFSVAAFEGISEIGQRVTGAGLLSQADAEFIAHARDDVPALVAEVRRLRALIGGAS